MASPAPFFTHVDPRRHLASFGDISAKEIADLGRVLRTVMGKLHYGLQNPDFNLTKRVIPEEAAEFLRNVKAEAAVGVIA